MIFRFLRGVLHPRGYSRRLLLLSFVALLLLITLTTTALALLQSYRFCSSLIDARLAGGYLTSRPGIYAAPRSISVGQALSRDDFVKALRRSGYTEGIVSD